MPVDASSSRAPASASTARSASESTPTSARPGPVPPKISNHFSKSQLALALAIQKSTPAGVSTSDYCLSLRKSIKAGRSIPTDKLRVVDSADFWKDQYCNIHQEKKALEDRVLRLEEEQRILREGIGGDDSQENGPFLVRDLLARSYGIRNGESRKRHAPADVEEWIEDQHIEIEEASGPYDVEGSVRLSSYVLRIARQRIELEKTLGKMLGKDLEYLEEATHQSLQMVAMLQDALSDCCLPLHLLKTNDADFQPIMILQQLMHQIVLGYRSCFEALDLICRTIPGRTKKQSELVYPMVMFISKALNFLQTISNIQTEQDEAQGRRRQRTKRAKTDEGEYAVNKYLAWALSSIISSLDWKVGKESHSELLEGILFSILEHTGRLLADAVFTEQVSKSTNPGNITEGATDQNFATARIESRYVVQILRAAVGNLEKKELAAKVLAHERKKLQPLISATFRKDPVSTARRLIQNTLVKSAIGGQFTTLELPPAPTDTNFTIETVDQIEPYGPEWLIEMVWAFIGWDLVVGDT